MSVIINDADYPITITVDGKRVRCPFHARWSNLTGRVLNVYDRSYDSSQIVEDWLTFSNFKAWMEQQDWEGKELDKDILVKGNQVYGPDTCVFVPRRLNTLLNTQRLINKNSLLGVNYSKPSKDMINSLSKPWRAQVSSFDQRQQLYLGCYATQEEAHYVWQIAKSKELEKAIVWYMTQDSYDTRVVNALKSRKEDLEKAAQCGTITYTL